MMFHVINHFITKTNQSLRSTPPSIPTSWIELDEKKLKCFRKILEWKRTNNYSIFMKAKSQFDLKKPSRWHEKIIKKKSWNSIRVLAIRQHLIEFFLLKKRWFWFRLIFLTFNFIEPFLIKLLCEKKKQKPKLEKCRQLKIMCVSNLSYNFCFAVYWISFILIELFCTIDVRYNYCWKNDSIYNCCCYLFFFFLSFVSMYHLSRIHQNILLCNSCSIVCKMIVWINVCFYFIFVFVLFFVLLTTYSRWILNNRKYTTKIYKNEICYMYGNIFFHQNKIKW